MDTQPVPLLAQRQIEARILAPFIEDLSAAFGEKAVLEVLHHTIQRLARQQGREMAARLGGNALEHLRQVIDWWQEGEALEIQPERQDETHLDFRVSRCAYAEMYHRLGLAHLGATLSCQRDAAFIQGFNPALRFERTQTLMEGAPFCDFHYSAPATTEGQASEDAAA